MQCPKCQERTEVLETIQRGADTKRRRRCLSCLNRFQTIERHLEAKAANEDLERDVRKMLRGPQRIEPDVLAAMIRTDRRKRVIAAEQAKRERYEDDDAAPRTLNRFTLRREVRGY
jgi:transcriptional regulator NrdR family protein